jgi:heat shock protein HslJ
MAAEATPEPGLPAPRLPAMHTLQRLTVGLAAALLLASLAACAAAQSPTFTDRTFLSVSVTDGGTARPLAAGTRVRLDFGATNLGASAGCNSMSGTYRVEGGRLAFEGGGMTDMACDPERMTQDTWLIKLLESKPAVRLAGDELTLESGSTVLRLLDRKVVEPDVALTGHRWTVESIVSGEAVSSIPQGASATLTFNADGSIDVDDGCNQGSARWSTVAGGIQVSDLVLTKKACQGAGAALEDAVVRVLRAGTIAAAIAGNALTLRAGANGLQLRAS